MRACPRSLPELYYPMCDILTALQMTLSNRDHYVPTVTALHCVCYHVRQNLHRLGYIQLANRRSIHRNQYKDCHGRESFHAIINRDTCSPAPSVRSTLRVWVEYSPCDHLTIQSRKEEGLNPDDRRPCTHGASTVKSRQSS
jgi:hypothetical protein